MKAEEIVVSVPIPVKSKQGMGRFKNLLGMSFGKLTVESFAGRLLHRGNRFHWNCICSCGNRTCVGSAQLINGNTKSCGCFKKELPSLMFKTHGMGDSPEYGAWRNMKERCLNDKTRVFKWYGARGITVCPAWIDSFEVFLADMGMRPSAKHSIDRIDNNKGYSPENCRWVTRREQSVNRTTTIIIPFNGEERCISDWEFHLGVKKGAIGRRLSRKWSIERALTTPFF